LEDARIRGEINGERGGRGTKGQVRPLKDFPETRISGGGGRKGDQTFPVMEGTKREERRGRRKRVQLGESLFPL